MQAFCTLAKTPQSSPDRIKRLKTALKLYRGPLLAAEEQAHWAIAPRARLQKAAHKIVMEVGMCYESSGKWSKAIRVYRSGLHKNAVDEQMWRHLMRCYQRSGRDEDALASYQQCCRELKEKLARNPSAKTKILAESIVHH